MSKTFSNIELTAIATMLIVSVFSLIVVLSLIIEKKGNRILRNAILIILIGNFLYSITHLLGFTGLVIYIPFSLRIFTPFYYILPPTVYFYVVFNLNETFKFKAKHIIHLIPFFISLIDNLDTFFLTAEQVAQSTKIIAENYKNYGNFSGILFPVKYNYILRMSLYITYLLFSWRYYLNYVNNQKTENEKRIVRWLKYFLMVFGIFILSTAFSLFYNFKYLIEKNYNEITLFPFIFVGFAVIILCAFIFFNPILLYGIPRIQNLNIQNLQTEKKQVSIVNKLNSDSPAIDKTANNAESIELNEDAVKELQLAKSIIREIKELQLYKDTQFSLVKASIHFNVPVHHISFVLNNQIKKSFPDVISKMRVEHAIALIENSKNKKYTLEAIGNMSGFRSRTTFYVSFKKITGVSPLEYSNLSNNESKNNEL